MATNFRDQDYYKLKKECQKENKLFTDSEFPPTNLSVYLDKNQTGDLVWKRPKEIVDDPKLFVEGASVNGVVQGTLGNCWFVSGCSALTRHKSLLNKVIPDKEDQDWSDKEPDRYNGIFHFQFWRFGDWTDVVVDDLLPTRDGQLHFARSKTPNEFWSALLEKAFAKLYGCYESLTGGHLADALLDLSGGVPETISLTEDVFTNAAAAGSVDAKLNLFNHLKEADENRALIAASIKPTDATQLECRLDTGLVVGHAYAVTAVRKIELDDTPGGGSLLQFFQSNPRVLMIRLQNPWGGVEWTGPWADSSQEWAQVSASQKKELGIVVEEDGEFWMTWYDFCKNFTDVTVCQMINTSFFSFKKRFRETVFVGAWRKAQKGVHYSDRAGGCSNFAATFTNNPQYLLDVREDQLDTVMLSLSQKETPDKIDPRKRVPHLTIGMHVLKVEANRRYRLHQKTETLTHSSYANTRSALLNVRNLKQGAYVILPTTFSPDEQADFMLRVYAVGDVVTRELVSEKPSAGICGFCCCCKSVSCSTRCKVVEARGLQTSDGSKAVDPYFIIKCEGDKYQSPHLIKDPNPKWDIKCLFMRKYPRKSFEIELWDSNMLRDAYLGGAKVASAADGQRKRVEISLQDKDNKVLAGRIVLEVEDARRSDALLRVLSLGTRTAERVCVYSITEYGRMPTV